MITGTAVDIRATGNHGDVRAVVVMGDAPEGFVRVAIDGHKAWVSTADVLPVNTLKEWNRREQAASA